MLNRQRASLIVVVLVLAVARIGAHADDAATIVLGKQDGRDRITVAGLEKLVVAAVKSADLTNEVWQQVFAIRVETGTADDMPAMLGDYRVDGQQIEFEPRFPLQAGLSYRVVFDPSRIPGSKISGGQIVKVLKIPAAPAGPRAKIVEVYPTRDTLPENQLKFYIQFSAPMSRGEAYRRVHLVMDNGDTVQDPFLELGEELWDPDGTRFTLLFDPGRIKRGLKPREEVGPSLEEGRSYTLVIDADWSDAAGRPLAGPFRKAFRVGPPDDVQPDVERWKITPPPAGTTDPLVVMLDEPLDWAMLERVLVVRDSEGHNLPGKVNVDHHETRWSFVPEHNWDAGGYQLDVDAALEDLAGNNLSRPFEVDVLRPVEREVVRKSVTRAFAVQLPR